MGVVVEVGVVVVRWQWRWRPIHLSSSSLRLSHSSSCTSKMRDESDAIASGSSADTSTSRCGSRIGRSSEASKASGSSWGRGGAGVRRRCRESRRAGVAVVEAHLRSVGGTQSHRSAPRRRRAAACAVERNGARLVQRPSHHLRRRAGGGEPSKWQSGGDAAAALAPAALASSVARTGARPEGRPSGRIGTSLVLRRCAKCGKMFDYFTITRDPAGHEPAWCGTPTSTAGSRFAPTPPTDGSAPARSPRRPRGRPAARSRPSPSIVATSALGTLGSRPRTRGNLPTSCLIRLFFLLFIHQTLQSEREREVCPV